ncbi:MAG: hypothetical protein HYU64_05385 [Armatimonadetes bacterium]|nr:hypothetical protein [Armatimonadota bacterium]
MKVTSTGKIEYDLGANLLKMKDVRTPDLVVDEMDIHIEKGNEFIERLLDLSSLAKGNGKIPLAPFYALQQAPKKIESFRIRIPQESASHALEAASGDRLAKEGIKNVNVSFEDENQMSLSGRIHRLVDIPFHVSGRISLGEDHKVRYSVDKMDLLGLIPLPHILRTLILALNDISAPKEGFQRDGNSYTLDLQSFLPEKTKARVDRAETEDGFLILEGKG